MIFEIKIYCQFVDNSTSNKNNNNDDNNKNNRL